MVWGPVSIIRVLPGTPNIFTRVFMGTFTWRGGLCVYFLVIVVTPLTSCGGPVSISYSF